MKVTICRVHAYHENGAYGVFRVVAVYRDPNDLTAACAEALERGWRLDTVEQQHHIEHGYGGYRIDTIHIGNLGRPR